MGALLCVCEESARESQTERAVSRSRIKNILAFDILGDTANRHDGDVLYIMFYQ